MRKNLIAALTLCLSCFAASPAGAAPYVPAGDAVVLERLPEKTDPSLRRLKAMRASLAANPRNADIALPLVRRAIEAARETGDPRFLGQAQGALAPWWHGTDVPAPALLLRATLKQSQHDFDGALRDLDTLLVSHPDDGQALLTRATVRTVQGRFADARSDCARLASRTIRLVTATCDAAPASLSGEAEHAYAALASALSDAAGAPADLREWSLTLLAEIAARRGDAQAAQRHFTAALQLDPRDPYLKAAYADFLLDHEHGSEVVALLRDDERNDGLLLRLALAEQALPAQRDAFDRHKAELRARFDAAQRRGDALHLREQARFELAIERDEVRALELARANWKVQREPADLRVLAEAADALGDRSAQAMVREWVAKTGLDDPRFAAASGVQR